MNGQSQQQPGSKPQSHHLIRQEIAAFSGPLPPPAILEHYEKILPGAADRIITMAEQQSSHRREIEKKVIDSDISNSRCGLNFGLIIGLAALAASVILALNGQALLGGALGLAYIVSLVGTFVYGSRGKSRELTEKRGEVER
jgi:uncharacterized membrane protein